MAKPVTFISKKYASLTVVIDPLLTRKEQGRVVVSSLNGEFPQGLRVEFNEGQYITSDPKIIKSLKEHKNYGAHFFAIDEEIVTPKEEAKVEEDKQKQFKAKIEAESKANSKKK